MSGTVTMEAVACPMCGADSPAPFVEGGDLLHPGTEVFRLLSCRRCGHLYQSPRPTPEAIDRYYPDDYHVFQGAIEDEPSRLRRVERRFGLHNRCALLQRAAGRPGRLLDVGCATGIFLDGMRRRGWEVCGVEPSPAASEYARARFGLDVLTGRLEEAGHPPASFDAITLWDVLEHVHEPRRTLSDLARLLRPGGLLLLSLPNPDSLEARLLGPGWIGWDLPRHLNLFRPPLLRAALASHGLAVEQISSPIHGYATLVMSLEQRARARGGRPERVRRLLMAPPLRALAALYYRGPASWYNLSSTMVVIARRQQNPAAARPRGTPQDL